MAGHRRAAGKPTREKARADRMARRVASAGTPEQRAAAAFDALRMAAAHAAPEDASLALNDAASHMLGVTRWLTESERR